MTHKNCGGTIAPVPVEPSDYISMPHWKCGKCGYIYFKEQEALDASMPVQVLRWRADPGTGMRYASLVDLRDSAGLDPVLK